MRHIGMAVVITLAALLCVACGDTAPPASPSPAVTATASAESGAGATAIGLTGLVRGLNLRNSSFSLVTRTKTYEIRFDGQTQLWSGGAQVRATALKDGQTASIRGLDYGAHVQAVSISINR